MLWQNSIGLIWLCQLTCGHSREGITPSYSNKYGISVISVKLNEKNLKVDTPKMIIVFIRKKEVYFYNAVFASKNEDGRAKSVEAIQTAPLRAGSALCAQSYLPQYIEFLHIYCNRRVRVNSVEPHQNLIWVCTVPQEVTHHLIIKSVCSNFIIIAIKYESVS